MGTWENSVALENKREYRDDLSSCWRWAQDAQVGTGLDLDHCDAETREMGGKETEMTFPRMAVSVWKRRSFWEWTSKRVSKGAHKSYCQQILKKKSCLFSLRIQEQLHEFEMT